MKTLLFTIGLFTSILTRGQNCSCDKDTMLNELISCKPYIFKNNAKLYWSFNCDSSWLTFQNPKGRRKILYSLDKDFIDLTTRIGHVNFKEFKNTFLYTNKVISGCCDPEDYYLYDKANGDSVKYLGRAIYVSDKTSIPFVVSITNDNYEENSITNFNSLTIYNLDTRKEFKLALPRGDIKKAIKTNNYMFPEYVFDTPTLVGNTLILKYSTHKYIKGRQLKYKTIKINLKKYSS